MDLVGPGPTAPHFDDAREVAAWLAPQIANGEVWADLGSGAGFPGVALAAHCPQARVWMVERRQKRAAFLETVAAEGRLTNAEIRCASVDDLPGGALDGVISRAFAPPPEVLVHARRLLRPGGRLVLMLALEGVPAGGGFSEAGALAYRVDGKDRRAVLLVRD